MRIFVTGTDTGIGKTLVCSWLCMHSGYAYFKPIQTGEVFDKQQVAKLANCHIHDESYIYKDPLSPHLAARLAGDLIDVSKITLPAQKNLIIEGAGGVMVPINDTLFLIDLMIQFKVPVLVVASSRLGTINHTLLTLQALRSRSIEILGVIMNGEHNKENEKAISYYGEVPILAAIPQLETVSKEVLQSVPLTPSLKKIFNIAE